MVRKAVYCIVEVKREAPLRFDYFKIGVSSNIYGRLATLQTGTPRRLAVLFVEWFADDAEAHGAERAAHQYLAEHGVSGEWFRHAPMSNGCPFEALAIATRNRQPIASEYFYDHPAPAYEPILLQASSGRMRARQ